MKKVLFGAVVLISCLAACRKEAVLDLPEDNGCIERVFVPVSGHTINNADVALVNSLFRNNGIENHNYRYYRYSHDSVQTYFSPYTKFDQKIVRVDEYTNGLPIFTGDLVYSFKDNLFSYRGGNPTNGTKLNTVPRLTLGQLRKLFLDNAERFEHRGLQFKDSCFKAEFGYYNLNAGTSNAAESLIKVWRITLKNSIYPSEYPVAFYQDNDGKLIYYDNGIRTFK